MHCIGDKSGAYAALGRARQVLKAGHRSSRRQIRVQSGASPFRQGAPIGARPSCEEIGVCAKRLKRGLLARRGDIDIMEADGRSGGLELRDVPARAWATRVPECGRQRLAIAPNLREERGPGGAERDRTADLVIANDALSQLSYSPQGGCL